MEFFLCLCYNVRYVIFWREVTPTLSMFYGIIVRMFAESGGKHHLPHIHAKYNEHEVVLDFEGNVLEGYFPRKQLRLLLGWMEIHYDELVANWNLLRDDDIFFKIEPLK